MVAVINIAGKKIGTGNPCFVIAEAGVNHNGNIAMAKKLIDVAITARADAVKFQTFNAEQMMTESAPQADYQAKNLGKNQSQIEMIRPLQLPVEAFSELNSYCKAVGIIFISTPFDHDSVDVLDRLGVPAFKIGSGELTNWPLLEHVAAKNKPVILSTGMANLGEVDESLRLVQESGSGEAILLHCTSNYPAQPEDVNLNAMQTMATAFPVPVGYSDHTADIDIPIAAVALGANVIEKHFTLDDQLEGPDHKASLEPDQLSRMIQGIRRVEESLGDGIKRPVAAERNTAAVARRSLVSARAISAGEKLSADDIRILRPGTGIPPRQLKYVVGRRVGVDIRSGTVLTLDMFD